MPKVELHYWPESQACIGCKNSCLVNEPEKVGSSAYICLVNITPDGEKDGCSKYCQDIVGGN